MAYVFFIPISTALMNLFLYLALILITLNKDFIKNIKISWKNYASRSSLLFFLFVILGSLWSTGSYEDILESISTYKKSIFIFLMLPFLIEKKNNELLLNAFFISMALILCLVYLIFLDIIQPINVQLYKGVSLHVSESGGFKTHIITNILFAFSGFMSIHRFFDLNKVVYFLLGVLSFYYSIFINDGTTGQILSISLLSILIIQKYRYKAVLILPIALLGILTYGASNNNTSIYSAINKVHTGLGDFESGTAVKSVDVRLAMLTNGLIIIKENPWIGTGTGSINQSHIDNLDKFPPTFEHRSKTTNPHSEHLSIAIQYGLIGLLLYLFLIYKLFEYTKKLPNDFYKNSAQGLLILILIGSLGTSIITDSGEGHFIMLFIAILFAPLSNQAIRKNG
jgi:O-antigen ligase